MKKTTMLKGIELFFRAADITLGLLCAKYFFVPNACCYYIQQRLLCACLLLQGCIMGNWVSLYFDDSLLTYHFTMFFVIVCTIGSLDFYGDADQINTMAWLPNYFITFHLMPFCITHLNMVLRDDFSQFEEPLLNKDGGGKEDEAPV